MEHRRTQPDQRRCDQDDDVVMRGAQQQQAEEGGPHADGERERLRLLVGEMPDQRLQQRRRELERQRDHADLGEVERVAVLQDRIDRGDQRLHGVVEEVREADSGKHDVGRPGRRRRPCRRVTSGTITGSASASSETTTGLFTGSSQEIRREILRRVRDARRPTYAARNVPTSTIDNGCDANGAGIQAAAASPSAETM